MYLFDPVSAFPTLNPEQQPIPAAYAEPLERLIETLQQGSLALLLRAEEAVSGKWLTAGRIEAYLRRALMESVETQVWPLCAQTWAISVAQQGDAADPANELHLHALRNALLEQLETKWNQEQGVGEEAGESKKEKGESLITQLPNYPTTQLPNTQRLFTLFPVAQLHRVDNIQENIAELNELLEIILKKRLHPQFQPIVHLSDGQVLGYEALIRGPKGALLRRPGAMFRAATKASMVAWFDVACQAQCFARAAEQGVRHLLFVNMDAEGLDYLDRQEKSLAQYARECGLEPSNVVVEVTERQTIHDFPRLLQGIERLREQGFQIAVDDVGAGYSSLNAIAQIRPEFLKIDHALIRHIDTDGAQRALVAALVQYGRDIGAAVLAEGAETREELATLIDLGVKYGQGYLMGRPADDFRGVPRETREFMQRRAAQREQMATGRQVTVGGLAHPGVPLPPDTPLAEAARRFAKDASLTSVVVVEDGFPRGLVMREQIAHVLDRMRAAQVADVMPHETVAQWMRSNVLFAEEQAPVAETAGRAMRNADISLEADIVVVGANGKYLGTLSSRALLEAAAVSQENQARYAHPLTGLPGRVVLEKALQERLSARSPLAVIRADISRLEAYNRRFGVENGDRALQAVARLLQKVSETAGCPDDFLAHLGDDDFVLLAEAEAAEAVCRALVAGFQQLLPQFYSVEQVRQGFVETHDQHGNRQRYPLFSLAVAAQTNRKRRLTHYGAIMEMLDGMLRLAKGQQGSRSMIDRSPESG